MYRTHVRFIQSYKYVPEKLCFKKKYNSQAKTKVSPSSEKRENHNYASSLEHEEILVSFKGDL